MPSFAGIVAVRFHGGFLDGRTARSDDALTGEIIDYWNAMQVYDVTGGQVGAFMSGVAPDGFDAIRNPGPMAATVVLHHRYRVTASHVEDGTLTIDVDYDFVPS